MTSDEQHHIINVSDSSANHMTAAWCIKACAVDEFMVDSLLPRLCVCKHGQIMTLPPPCSTAGHVESFQLEEHQTPNASSLYHSMNYFPQDATFKTVFWIVCKDSKFIFAILRLILFKWDKMWSYQPAFWINWFFCVFFLAKYDIIYWETKIRWLQSENDLNTLKYSTLYYNKKWSDPNTKWFFFYCMYIFIKINWKCLVDIQRTQSVVSFCIFWKLWTGESAHICVNITTRTFETSQFPPKMWRFSNELHDHCIK